LGPELDLTNRSVTYEFLPTGQRAGFLQKTYRPRIEWTSQRKSSDRGAILKSMDCRGDFVSCLPPWSTIIPRMKLKWIRLKYGLALLAAVGIAGPAFSAQSANRIAERIDSAQVRALPNHHPLWAAPANDAGTVLANQPLESLTLILARSPEQEQAFERLLADQQNPASPDYHHWLTPDEVGERFGLSDQDIATITGWLQSQGLHVNWIAPNRVFIGFGGTAANVGRAFQTVMHYYTVNGARRISVNSNPMIPAALAPVIKAVRGLYSIDEQPAHRVSAVENVSPQLTAGGSHYMTPNDFDTIYDVPVSVTGAGVTIGIVSWSRTNSADFNNFKSKTGATFTNPTEVIPTVYGGIDPGPALTAPPSGSSSTLGGQEEATLDVIRAGGVAPAASLLLVVSSPSGANDGISADAQYLVNTTPVPAQVMSISFGACESSAGPSGVAFWNSLFQSAAAEGISVFVSSGDSGAAGCDAAFSAPPAFPLANSPNYICSSSYATCVGGTEFADTASPSTYWSSTNGSGYGSALSYIPEGAWNESTSSNVAATGGGVSTIIATPSWQTGTGVPAARAGRYTPDVSFSSSGHDGYFACMAAISGGSCVTSGGSFGFIIFSGTSAAAPGMAGVAALLDQNLAAAQGNLNPQLYSMAASVPTAFHDATVSSSGVSGCSVNTASMCNNSIPKASGSGAQAGFLLGTGYDEATGLGSVNVSNLVSAWGPSNFVASASQLSFGSQLVNTSSTVQPLTLSNNLGSAVSITSITASTNWSETNTCGSSLARQTTCTVSVTFKPTAIGALAGTLSIQSPQGNISVSLTGTGIAPMVSFSAPSITFASQTVGITGSAQMISLQNTGTATLTGIAISITGTNAPDFGKTTTCGTTLAAGSSCPISIVFTPGGAGPRTATLSVADNASGSPQTISITGTGVIGTTTSTLQFIPVTPCRIADTRNATGAFGGPELAGGSTRTFNIPDSACGIPSTAVAYSLNVTVVPSQSLGYLTIWPAGQAQPIVSTLNSYDGRVKANATITPAGTSGGVSVYVTDTTHFILDIDGYFVPNGTNSSGLAFFPLTPCRIADTRNAAGPLGGPSLTGGVARSFPVQSSSCGIPATAQAYSLNITAVPQGKLGYLTAWPSGQAQPLVSTLNSYTGTVTANAAIVPAGSGGDVSIYVSNSTDVVLDVNGYFAPPATGGLSLYTVPPCRVLDTRNGAGVFKGTLAVPVQGSTCAPPATAQAYVLNATVVPSVTLGYLTLWPDGGTQPIVSTLNSYDGTVTSNMAIVPTTNGSIDAYSTDFIQLIFDLSSYFAP
jgi:pseudomonalisin